ncbi:hypothetical protein [Bosea lathyri]|uniref:Uncharacterized protein n=1 Tax=Bosea lathyri TaxID=1036778 RepID=A0A1H6C7G6_9HYPH|nr:hypothetical protein [Bosea lathyri]SEG68862.1 hypothetical protein SAMN04488115_10993 [Bosea lathyri]
MASPAPKIDGELDDIECEIAELIAEHGSERAAMRALLADADQAVSRGYLKGKFSEGARRPQIIEEEP